MKNNYSLYIHVPFCERKCDYCSFYSVRKNNELINLWLDGISREAEKYKYINSQIKTLYIGGGTPTVLNLFHWEKLMNIIRVNFDISCMIEATCEANPNSLSHKHIKFLIDNKFTRISLGVQSLNDNELLTLGRIHDSKQAIESMELIRKLGMNLSCDLIFAIPGQNLRTWDKSLRLVMKYASHISTYQLTLEENTPLSKKYDNEELNMQGYKFYRYAQYILPKNKFMQYEISNFARENFECRHNIAYWNQDNVIALGPSAVSYIDGVRISNPATLEKYLADVNNKEYEKLSEREKLIELAILSMRTKWGIKREKLLPEIENIIMNMPRDLFVISENNIALTQKGMRLGNAIWCEFIGV